MVLSIVKPLGVKVIKIVKVAKTVEIGLADTFRAIGFVPANITTAETIEKFRSDDNGTTVILDSIGTVVVVGTSGTIVDFVAHGSSSQVLESELPAGGRKHGQKWGATSGHRNSHD